MIRVHFQFDFYDNDDEGGADIAIRMYRIYKYCINIQISNRIKNEFESEIN